MVCCFCLGVAVVWFRLSLQPTPAPLADTLRHPESESVVGMLERYETVKTTGVCAQGCCSLPLRGTGRNRREQLQRELSRVHATISEQEVSIEPVLAQMAQSQTSAPPDPLMLKSNTCRVFSHCCGFACYVWCCAPCRLHTAFRTQFVSWCPLCAIHSTAKIQRRYKPAWTGSQSYGSLGHRSTICQVAGGCVRRCQPHRAPTTG